MKVVAIGKMYGEAVVVEGTELWSTYQRDSGGAWLVNTGDAWIVVNDKSFAAKLETAYQEYKAEK